MSFLVPLIGLLAGIIASHFLESPVWGFILISLGTIFYILILKKSSLPLPAIRYNSLHFIWIFLLFAGIGLITTWVHRPHILTTDELSYTIGFEGEVVSQKSFASGDQLVIDVYNLISKTGQSSECSNLTIILSTDGFSSKKGDIITCMGNLSEITDNPNYRSSAYRDRMANSGILYKSIVSSENIKIKGFNNSIHSRSSLWRDRIEILLEKSSLDRETSDFLIAFLLGDKSFLSSNIKESFSNNGVAHILALSGMHVAIVMSIIMALLFPMSLAGCHKIRYWIALCAIWCFAYFTGFAASTVRACIMASFVVISLSFQRRRNSGNALLASLLVILIFEPSAIYDAGLQLSFVCVGCILLFAAQLNPVNHHMHPRLHLVVSSVIVTLVATMGSWVLVSYYFSRIPILFIPANLIILPLLPIYMGTAILYVCFLISGMDLQLLSTVLDSGYSLFIYILDSLSSLGNFTLDYKATLPVVVLWLLGILISGYAINRGKKGFTVMLSILFLISSVAIGPLLTSHHDNSVIIQKKYRDLSMMIYNGSKENLVSFPRNTVSRFVHENYEIFSIDCVNFADSYPKWFNQNPDKTDINAWIGRNRKRRYLLIGSGFKKNSLEDIPFVDMFEKIIIHPSLKRNREDSLIKEAHVRGMESIHSIRRDGPLEILFENNN